MTVVEVGSDPANETFEEFMQRMETNETTGSPSSSAIGPRNNDMVITMRIGGHKAKTLLDTETTGTNLITGIFVQTYNIQTELINPPIIIRLTTKGSKTVAKEQVTCPVEITKGITIKTKFLVVLIKEYQAIMGMPFLQQQEVRLDTANGTAIFGKHRNYTIQCNEARLASTTILATAATEIGTLLDFKSEFPEVFPNDKPKGLPPLREGCNHTIRIISEKRSEFRKSYVLVARAWLGHLKQFLDEWTEQGIAVPAEGHFACPTFAVKKPGKNEPCSVHDLRARNKITERDYTPIPEQ